MEKSILILVVIITFSCGTKKENQELSSNEIPPTTTEVKIIQKDSAVTTRVENDINFFDYNLRRWNGKTWEEYINTGNSDTAVTLYVYRILTSDEEPDFVNWAAFSNLYENTETVKSIIQNEFSNENQTNLIFQGIDKINSDFLQYARERVESDIREYGQSDGPYFSFVEKHGE